MQLSEYKDEILLKLGSPIVSVEIEDVIERVIQASFRELKKYISLSKMLTVPFNSKIDLSPYDIQTVHYLMRDRSSGTDNNMVDAFYLATTMTNTAGSISDYTRYLTIQQIKDTMSSDLDYTQVGDTLYVSCTTPNPTSITIVYTPKFIKVEDIVDDFWCDLLMRLSLANSKVVLGRVRDKYKNNTALYNLDGEALLAEGNAELTEIREYLTSNYDTVLPID